MNPRGIESKSDNVMGCLVPWFKRRPAKRRENNMTRLPIRFATPDSWKIMPMKRHNAAEVRLKRTRTNRKEPNSGHPATRPTMG